MNKKLLIIAWSAFTPRAYDAFRQLQELGYQLYLLSDFEFTLQQPEYFVKHWRTNLGKIAQAFSFVKKQKIKFDAVLTKAELMTPLAALLTKHYKALGNSPRVAFNCRSKYHMREQLKKGKVPEPKFKLCHNFSDLKKAIEIIGLPCVAKPVAMHSSYGTFLIKEYNEKVIKQNYQKAIKFLKSESKKDGLANFSQKDLKLFGIKSKLNLITGYLVEEFLAGPEISVDALVQNSKVNILGIEDQLRMKPPYFLQEAARFPYQCNDKKLRQIELLIKKTIKAMNIKNSATHTEIIFTPNGPKIVELGCRMGGDDLLDTVYEVTGYNMLLEAALIALGVKRKYKVETRCHTAFQYIIPQKRGVLTKINISGLAKNNPNIYLYEECLKPGETVIPPPEDFNYLAFVAVKGKTPNLAKKNLQKVLAQLVVEIS